MEEYLLIGEAAEECGVTTKQLRNWAELGYIPNPGRVGKGDRSIRTYAPQDIQLIKRLKQYLDEGYTLQAATGKVNQMKSEE